MSLSHRAPRSSTEPQARRGPARARSAFAWLAALAFTLGACADSPTQPRDEQARLTVSAAVAGTPIATIVITVSAADIARPLVFNLTVHDGLATGTLNVPPGPSRTFTAQGFDATGEITHEGEATADIRKGDNPPLYITMIPRTGQVPITITIGSVRVVVTPASVALTVDATRQLVAEITRENGQPVQGAVPVWASSNPAVASVDQSGLVTAHAPGQAQIMAVFAGSGGASDVTVSSAPAPSAARIAFVSYVYPSAEIYVMNPDGTDQTRLTNNSDTDQMPTWSPDRTRIAFVSDRDGNDEIYVMNADGSGQTRLTNDEHVDYHPAWSPDGAKIAFARAQSCCGSSFEIYVMNADGASQTRLTYDPSGESNSYPAWSPDGTHIAFTSSRGDGHWRLYVMNADGTNQARLTDNPGTDAMPAWSPDGARIAFASMLGSTWSIYVVNVDGTGQTRLSNAGDYDWMPSWSPDGTRIAFDGLRDGNYDIYAMNPDGTGQTRLTTAPGADNWPAWR